MLTSRKRSCWVIACRYMGSILPTFSGKAQMQRRTAFEIKGAIQFNPQNYAHFWPTDGPRSSLWWATILFSFCVRS